MRGFLRGARGLRRAGAAVGVSAACGDGAVCHLSAMACAAGDVRAAWGSAVVGVPLIAALVLVGACSSSPPTRFYTLNDTAPEAPPPTGVGWVRIIGVNIPGELDRPELVRRVGPNQLSIAGLDRWAAPLDQVIRRTLSDDISRRVPSPAPGQQYSVSVDIREFNGDEGCNVTLRAAWTVQQTRPADAHPVSEEIKVPSSGACTATLPATMSVALGQLSDRIIAGVARMPPPAAPPAPATPSAPAIGSAPAH